MATEVASRRGDGPAGIALAVIFLLLAALFALILYVTYVLPARVAAMQAAGIVSLPPGMKLAIQVSNLVTTRWFLFIGPVALILVLLLSRLSSR